MNIRLVFLIFLVVVFALGTGFMSYSQTTGISLKQAYSSGSVILTQSSTAGTVPHQVNITNTGNDPVKVQVGDILIGNSSQNLVIAENKTVKSNSTDIIHAYCMDPSTRAVTGAKLQVGNSSSGAVKQVIYGSNLNDLNNATDAQVQIWILTSGVDFNIYSGEPAALVENQNITYTKLKQMVSDSKNEIASRFNVNVNSIDSFNQSTTASSGGFLHGIYNWMKSI